MYTDYTESQFSAGLHNRNTVGQIWLNIFPESKWLSSRSVLYFLFKHFYLPSQHNSHTRWWLTFPYNSPSLLGSSGRKRIHYKRFLMLFFSDVFRLRIKCRRTLGQQLCTMRVQSPCCPWLDLHSTKQQFVAAGIKGISPATHAVSKPQTALEFWILRKATHVLN